MQRDRHIARDRDRHVHMPTTLPMAVCSISLLGYGSNFGSNGSGRHLLNAGTPLVFSLIVSISIIAVLLVLAFL